MTQFRGKRIYSPQFRPFFNFLIQQAVEDISERERDLIEPIFDRWHEKNRIFGTALTRSMFEETAQELLKIGKVKEIQTAMRWINATNHLAYGVGMSYADPEQKITVNTVKLKRISDLCCLNEVIPPPEVLELLGLSNELVSKILKAVKIPEVVIRAPHLWNRLGELLDPESKYLTSITFQRRKDIMQKLLDLVLINPSIDIVDELIDSCRAYSSSLIDGLGLSEKNVQEAYFNTGLIMGGDLESLKKQNAIIPGIRLV